MPPFETGDTIQPPPSQQVPTAKRKPGCLIGFICGLFAAAAFPFIMILIISVSAGLLFNRVSDNAPLKNSTTHETICFGDPDTAEYVIQSLSLDGVIAKSDSSWRTSANSSDALLAAIKDATEDDEIDGLLIHLNTPGGSVTDSDVIYHQLQLFKEAKLGRKVFVFGGELVASGGYYLAMQADFIMIQPTTIIGSIGVILPGINAAKLAQKIGIEDASITSGASKDMLNPLKPVDPQHVELLRGVTTHLYERFVSLVIKGRKLSPEVVKPIADGRVFHAQKALDLGLVDAIGYEDDCYTRIAKLIGKPIVVYTQQEKDYWRMIFGESLPFFSAHYWLKQLSMQAPTSPAYLMK